jgi:hypothetical protein
MRLEPGKKQTAWLAENAQAAGVAQPEPQSSAGQQVAPSGQQQAPREIKTPNPPASPVKPHAEPIGTARPSRISNRLSVEMFATLSPNTVAPASIGEALQLQVPDSTLDRLLQSERFTERLGTILEEYHQPEAIDPSSLDTNDLQVALTALEQFNHISLIAGAMWNGEALRTTLQKADIREMVSLLGREALAFAMMNALLPPSEAPTTKTVEAIRSDGVACFYAWASSVPKGIRHRMELRQPSLFHEIPVSSEAFLASGPSILRRAAQYIMSSSDEQ